MFAKACEIAKKYTFPIVISHKKVKGECGSGIGSAVIINKEGWIVTAYHIINVLQNYRKSLDQHSETLRKRAEIENDTKLLHDSKKRELKKYKIDPESIENFSAWVYKDGVIIKNVIALPEIDLAVCKLENFNPADFTIFPKFKDPSKDTVPGTSLCKLGFPFHSIVPTFEPTKGFVFPPGSFPIPLFPIEGIYTRTVNINVTGKAYPYPLMFVETSSPGLRGQSGGPTFDINGNIWAIQSQTRHLKLGFGGTTIKSKESEHLENQFLNVGWGVHTHTITEFLKANSINFELSNY